MVSVIVLLALIFGLYQFGIVRRQSAQPGRFTSTFRLAGALAFALAVSFADFLVSLLRRDDLELRHYLEYEYHTFALAVLALALAIYIGLTFWRPAGRPWLFAAVASFASYLLNSAGLLWSIRNSFEFGSDVIFDFFDRLFRFDYLERLWWWQGLGFYMLAGIVFLLILNPRTGRLASPLRPSVIREAPVSFKNSPNEPARLLLGQAAVGRLRLTDELDAENEHPCYARAFPLDVSHDRLLDVANERFNTDVNRKFIYTGLAIVSAIMIGAEFPGGIILTVLIAGIVFMRGMSKDRYEIAPRYQPGAFKPPDEQPEVASHNLVTYRGYAPFANFGIPFGSWVLVVDTARPKQDDFDKSRLRSPDIHEVENRIIESISHVGILEGAPRPLYFVQGANIPKEVKHPGAVAPPTSLADSKYDTHFATNPNAPVRRYLWIRKAIWNREVSISYFVRLFRDGDDLHLEINGVLMPPVAEEYRWVDKISPSTFSSQVTDFFASLIAGAFMMIWSPIWMFGKLNIGIGQALSDPQRNIRKSVEATPNFDFGAPLSIRRRVADSSIMSYFQTMDRRAAEAAFAGRVTRAFIDCLDDHGIDTSELREQRTTLLNQGIVVQGGDIKAENVAAGFGAKIKSMTGTAASSEKGNT